MQYRVSQRWLCVLYDLAKASKPFHVVLVHCLAEPCKFQLFVLGLDHLRVGNPILDPLVIAFGIYIESQGRNLWTKEGSHAWERCPGPGPVGYG